MVSAASASMVAGEPLFQPGPPAGDRAAVTAVQRLAETTQRLGQAFGPERVFERQRDRDDPLETRHQMCRAGAQTHRPKTRIGERALRGDPQHRLRIGENGRAGAQKCGGAAAGARLDPEHADSPHEAVALELASLHRPVALAAAQQRGGQDHEQGGVPP